MSIVSVGKSLGAVPFSDYHTHRADEIIVNLSGCGFYQIGEKKIPFTPGSVFCVPAGLPHKKEAQDRFEDIYVTIENRQVFREPSIFQDDGMNSMQHMLKILYYYHYKKESEGGVLADSLGDALFALAEERIPQEKRSEQAEYVQMKIIERFQDPEFSIDAVMAELPYCADHTRRLFREAFGMSPKEYCIRLRMEKAAELLRGDRVSVTDVALLCGYYDASYFARLFRSTYGISPFRFKNAGEDKI